MKTVITHNVLSFDKRLAKEQEKLQQTFALHRALNENFNKTSYDDYVRDEYNNYLITSPISKEIQQKAFKKYAQDYPDEAREMLLELNDR